MSEVLSVIWPFSLKVLVCLIMLMLIAVGTGVIGVCRLIKNWTNGQMTTPKSGKPRRVDMSQKLAQVLKDHLMAVESKALAQARPIPKWVFSNKQGGMLDGDNLRHRVFYKLLGTVGLRHVRLHDLRHSFATRLISNGES